MNSVDNWKKHYAANKEKIKARSTAFRLANPELYKRYCRTKHLRSTYGMELEDFEVLVIKQNNQCRLCNKPFTKTPHVDHCHETGKVRGLLCKSCNSMLAWFEKRRELILNYVQ